MTRSTIARIGRRSPLALAALLAAMTGPPAPRAGANYTITPLANLGSSAPTVYGTGLNASGAVAGTYSFSGGSSGFVAVGGSETTIPAINGASYSFAHGINDNGMVVGQSGLDAFEYNSTTQAMVDLSKTGGFGLGGTSAEADAINNSGQIVGAARNTSGLNQAYLYSNGTSGWTTKNLSALAGGGLGYGLGISADGTYVVGQQVFAGNANPQPFVYSGGTMTRIATLGGLLGVAYDVNNSGQVVGYSDTSAGGGNSVFHAFLSNGGGSPTDLTSGSAYANYNSEAFGIDANGDVVGFFSSGSFSSHGFLYSNGTLTDLNSLIDPTSGWTITQADAITLGASGQIQILAIGNNGSTTQALLLTGAVAVPEPPTIALLCSGAAVGLGLRRLSRRRIKAEDLAAEA